LQSGALRFVESFRFHLETKSLLWANPQGETPSILPLKCVEKNFSLQELKAMSYKDLGEKSDMIVLGETIQDA
jgi:hypothetical protein